MGPAQIDVSAFFTEKICAMVLFKEVRRFFFFLFFHSKITLLLPVMFAGIEYKYAANSIKLKATR